MRTITVLLGVAAAAIGSACCIVSAGEEVLLTHENVVIVWDEKAKKQHFIRQATFNSKGENFGFIVPTPAVPDLSVAEEKAFSLLQDLVPPETSFGCGAKSEEATGDLKAAGIEVLKEEQVGDYKATVVRATDGAALNAWLKKNGFVSRPAMTEWLDGYAKKKWVFTALKYKADLNAATSTDAVRISFAADRPHYPYRMPKDTWPDGHVRPLKLYFVSNKQMDAKYVESNEHWEARTDWSGPLPEKERGPLAEALHLKESDLPPNAQVTIFENGLNENGYDRDLYFAATPWQVPWTGAIPVALFAVLWAYTRSRRNRIHATPA